MPATNGITIRAVQISDAVSVAALSLELGYNVSAAQTAIYISAVLENVNDAAFVAVNEGIVIGWAHVFYTIRLESPPYCEIGGLVVNEKYRGRGIGKLLIESMQAWCKEKKCSTLRVRSNVKRKEAHMFYEHAGFKEIKEQKVFGKQQ